MVKYLHDETKDIRKTPLKPLGLVKENGSRQVGEVLKGEGLRIINFYDESTLCYKKIREDFIGFPPKVFLVASVLFV